MNVPALADRMLAAHQILPECPRVPHAPRLCLASVPNDAGPAIGARDLAGLGIDDDRHQRAGWHGATA
jgi:hypothetical protein